MTRRARTHEAVSKLIEQLKLLGVTEVDSHGKDAIAEAVQSAPCVLRGGRFTIANQHIIRPELMIVDSVTGTLGLVYFLPSEEHPFPSIMGGKPERRAKQEVTNAIEQCINEAAYVRHLFLHHGTAVDFLPWTIEVVFVTDLAPKSSEACDCRQLIGQVFRRLSAQTDLLYAVGLNHFEWPKNWPTLYPNRARNAASDVMSEDDPTELHPGVDKAFCWLMSNVKNWCERSKWTAPRRKLEYIELTHWRLPGKRRLSFKANELATDGFEDEQQDPAQTERDSVPDLVQFAFGPNGSGKSSFVEGFEYLLTGSIERLKNAESIWKAVANRSCGNERAEVELSFFEENNRRRFKPKPTNMTEPSEDYGIGNALSFRLDQHVMDVLMSAEPPDRTEMFLTAFFPGEAKRLLKDRDKAKQRAEEARGSVLAMLPGEVEGGEEESDEEEVNERDQPAYIQWLRDFSVSVPDECKEDIAWLHDPKKNVPIQWVTTALQSWLPRASDLDHQQEILHELKTIEPRLDATLQALSSPESIKRKDFEELFRNLHLFLEPIAKKVNERRNNIKNAIAALKAFQHWRFSERKIEDFEANLNQWLDCTATADLVKRQLQIIETRSALEDVHLPEDTQPSQLETLDKFKAPPLQAWAERLDAKIEELKDRLPTSLADRPTVGGKKVRDAFLSYSRENQDGVDRIRKELAGRGITLWSKYDEPDKVGSEGWEESLSQTGLILAFLSASALEDSEWTQKELQSLLGPESVYDATKLVIKLDETELPDFFNPSMQTIDLNDGLEACVDAIYWAITGSPSLSSEQSGALDRVSSELGWTESDSSHPKLGQCVSKAFNGHPTSFGDSTIGERGWAFELIDRLEKRDELLGLLTDKPHDPELTKFLDEFQEAHATWCAAEKKLQKDFLQLLAVVSQALNELRAVFTPARWAYDNIVIKHGGQASEHIQLETSVDGADVTKEFNTAQLNTTTLAMFLLLAPSKEVGNPFRLLILDDPFMGMDELTVATVARGVGRLVRIWKHVESQQPQDKRRKSHPNPFRILLFMHGDETLRQLRHEISGTVHRFPFLIPKIDKPENGRPLHKSAEPVRDKSGSETKLAPLDELLSIGW